MKITKYVLAAVALTAVGQNAIAADAAPADSKSGSFYVSAGTGYNAFPHKSYDYTDQGTPTTFSDNVSKAKGFAHSAAAGYMLDENLRAELELTYAKSSKRPEVGRGDGSTVDTFLMTFLNKEFGANASAYYSIDLGTVSPFVGAGIGIKSHQDILTGFNNTAVLNGAGSSPDQGTTVELKKDAKFKKQNRLFGKLEAGISVPVADDCVFLDLSYALSMSAKENFDDTDYTQISGGLPNTLALTVAEGAGDAIAADEFVKSSGKRVGHAVKAKVRFVF